MTGDLFMTKEELLKHYCQNKKIFSKADIMQYSLDNFYIRAVRTVQEWVAEGKVRRFSKDECLFRGLRGKMAWYEYKGGEKI